MPATNYTPIQLYRSTTSGNTPLAANMSAGEIALNIADNDMSMWMENASGTVKRFFNNPAALKYPTADGTSGQVIVTDGSGNLSFATPAGGALTNNVRQAVTSSATTTLNLNSGNVIDLTMAANITTLSFTNVPASGTPILIQIVVRNASDGTAYTIVWPNSVYWSGQYAATTIATAQTAPTLATGANGVTVIALLTTDGGTKWRGWVEATIPGGTIGQLYSFGYNNNGQLGLGNLTNYSSPKQVGALTNWAKVSTSFFYTSVVAIKTDGTLWAWGNNYFGQLGDNTRNTKNSPVQIGSQTDWASAQLGRGIVTAIKTTGTLWGWGNNYAGALGLNDTVSRSSPTQIGSLSTWSMSASGGNWSFAIKTDGTLWSWGNNSNGVLGLNNLTNYSSPKQVGALTDWSVISCRADSCVARKTNNSLWSWGRNLYGELGQNDTTNKSSPVQIGALTNWSKIVSGYRFCTAVKTDGTLWVWGINSLSGIGRGQLGLNNTTNYSSPKQVGSLTDWADAFAGRGMSLAVKTNGTLWSWGFGSYGGLGQGNTTSLSSPVQVGALTTWATTSASISASSAFGIAIGGGTINPA